MSVLTLDPTLTSKEKEDIERLRNEASEVILDPDVWFRTPNERLGGHEPIEVAAQGDEGIRIVRDLIESIRYGIPT